VQRMRLSQRMALLLVLLSIPIGCGEGRSASGGDADTDVDTDADSDSDTDPVDWALGQIETVALDQDGRALLELPTDAGQEYVIAASSLSRVSRDLYPYEVSVVQGEPAPPPVPPPGTPLPEELSEVPLYLRDPAYLEPPGPAAARIREYLAEHGLPPPMPVPQMGEHEQLCTTGQNNQDVWVDAEVIHVGEQVVVYINRDRDDGRQPGAAVLDQAVAIFEDVVLAREHQLWGEETDINQDGHVAVLFSPTVSEIGAQAYVSPADLNPGSSCSNGREIIHFDNRSRRMMESAGSIASVLAHEMQHLIYFNTKFLQHGGMDVEGLYITEGLSHLAEDLTGLAGSNFVNLYMALTQWDLCGLAEVLSTSFGYSENDTELRGLGYIFIHYMFDRTGGMDVSGNADLTDNGGVAFLHDLVNAPETGYENFERSSLDFFEIDLNALIVDFHLAVLLDDRTDSQGTPVSEDPRYRFGPVTIDPATDNERGISMELERWGFQLDGVKLQGTFANDGEVRAGGADYIAITDRDATGDLTRVEITFGKGDNGKDGEIVLSVVRVE